MGGDGQTRRCAPRTVAPGSLNGPRQSKSRSSGSSCSAVLERWPKSHVCEAFRFHRFVVRQTDRHHGCMARPRSLASRHAVVGAERSARWTARLSFSHRVGGCCGAQPRHSRAPPRSEVELAAIAERVGLAPSCMTDLIGTGAPDKAHEWIIRDVLAAGGFGVPTFVADDREVFSGTIGCLRSCTIWLADSLSSTRSKCHRPHHRDLRDCR